jgi:hypothetical protein
MKATRTTIIAACMQALEQIRTVNGYGCDIGQSVMYVENIDETPNQDCVAVIDGSEELGPLTRNNIARMRTMDLTISAAFVGNNPKTRANAAVEDILIWLDKNPGFGLHGVRVLVEGFDPVVDDFGQICELVAQLKVTF